MQHPALSVFAQYPPGVMPPHLAELMPPLLLCLTPGGFVGDFFHGVIVMPIPIQRPDATDHEKEDMKERNRLAAQRWRQKQTDISSILRPRKTPSGSRRST
jgi:hypothetical protein